MFAPALPGVPTKPNWPQPRMRLSLKESRMQLLNATELDRKSGIRGPKTMGEALRQPSSQVKTSCSLGPVFAEPSNRKMFPQSLLQLHSGPAGNANHFIPRPLPSHHLRRRARHRKHLSKEFHQRNIRLALDRRCRKRKLQRIANSPSNRRTTSPCMNPHRKRRPQRMVTYRNHLG